MSETPETDAELAERGRHEDCLSSIQKLAEERNDCRAKCHQAIKEAAEQSAELHQIRAVCDELALDVDGETSHEVSSLLAYLSLPHVKAKGTK